MKSSRTFIMMPLCTALALPALLMALGPSLLSAGEPPARRPNVLFLFADDQRADAIGELGNPHLKTPNLDRLARSGLVLRNAYCLGSNMPAVCTPSRNMLLSGRAYFRWQGPLAPADAPNFPDAMKAAGYETYHHGKRGNTATLIQKRFDHDHYVNDQIDRTNGEPCQTIVDHAIEFLEQRQNKQPFFMYLAFSNPHDPRVAAKAYRSLYKPEEIPLPANFLPVHPFDNGEMTIRDEKLAPWPRTPDEIRRHLHDYYAVISGMDHHIGRLLAKLDSLRLAEETIIIYSADHGLSLGSHGLMGKQNLYDDTMRVPLILRGPGIPAGRSDALVYLLDIFPTVCDLVGAPIPEGLDGQSMAGVLRDKPARTRETLFFAYRDIQRAIRDDRWKLIRYPKIDVTQLFDLRADPGEQTNLAGDPAHASRIAELTEELRKWQKDLGDTAPWTVANPKPARWIPPRE
jgi:arylsulfatase A-like enzyme